MEFRKISVVRKVPFIFAILMTTFPGAAAAADNTFVAVVYSPSTGNVAFAKGGSDMDARTKAMSECQGSGVSDCKLAFAGTDMCISLARSADEKSFGIGAGSSKDRSQGKALKECASHGGVGCNLHDTICGPASLD